MCFVIASLTAMIAKPSLPSASSAFSRLTPGVGSSGPPMMSQSCTRRGRRVAPLDQRLSLLGEGEVLSVVALRCCHGILSRLRGGEEPLVLALFPLDP